MALTCIIDLRSIRAVFFFSFLFCSFLFQPACSCPPLWALLLVLQRDKYKTGSIYFLPFFMPPQYSSVRKDYRVAQLDSKSSPALFPPPWEKTTFLPTAFIFRRVCLSVNELMATPLRSVAGLLVGIFLRLFSFGRYHGSCSPAIGRCLKAGLVQKVIKSDVYIYVIDTYGKSPL